MFKLSKNSLRILGTVDADLQQIIKLAITISLIDFGIPSTGGKRTAIEQHDLFVAGKSQKDGYDKPSYHQSGMAVDFYAYVDGKASWDEEHLTVVACAILQAASKLGINIQWGGFWKKRAGDEKNGIPYGWDMPHIQKPREVE